MWHVGIDLHRQTLVIAAVDDSGNALGPWRINCQDRVHALHSPARSRLSPAAISWNGAARCPGPNVVGLPRFRLA